MRTNERRIPAACGFAWGSVALCQVSQSIRAPRPGVATPTPPRAPQGSSTSRGRCTGERWGRRWLAIRVCGAALLWNKGAPQTGSTSPGGNAFRRDSCTTAGVNQSTDKPLAKHRNVSGKDSPKDPCLTNPGRRTAVCDRARPPGADGLMQVLIREGGRARGGGGLQADSLQSQAKARAVLKAGRGGGKGVWDPKVLVPKDFPSRKFPSFPRWSLWSGGGGSRGGCGVDPLCGKPK